MQTPALRREIASTLLPGFLGTTLPDWLRIRLENGLGGVCLFGQNIASPQQLRALTGAISAANPLAIIAIDEEGGDVTRLFYQTGAPFPGNAVLGRIDDLQLTEQIGWAVGSSLSNAGITVDFAPDADVNSNPDNPVIGIRSFGADPALVAEHSAAWLRGLQSTGIAATAKHFPGHGDTAQDSHLALPVIDRSVDELRSRELVPFRQAITAGVQLIMTSHILLPQLDAANPATMSVPILQGMLRGELGFEGVIVTDALDMAGASGEHGIPDAAVRALSAGCDLLCIGTENTDEQLGQIEDALLAAIADGTLAPARVAEAAGRIRELAASLRAERSATEHPPREVADGAIAQHFGANWDLSRTRAGSEKSGADAADAARELRARIRAAFDLQLHAHSWLSAHAGDHRTLRIDRPANIAVGTAPWGPRPAAGELTASSDAPDALRAALGRPEPLVVLGRDLHRDAFARGSIDALRAANPDVLVVDLGWPSDDRAYADIATFGASRLVSEALQEMLNGDAR